MFIKDANEVLSSTNSWYYCKRCFPREREREKDVGVVRGKIGDDVALEASNQRERKRKYVSSVNIVCEFIFCVCVCVYARKGRWLGGYG